MKNFKFRKIHFACIFALVGILVFVVCSWYGTHYYAGFEEILVTITSPLKGSDTTAIKSGFTDCAPKVALYFAVFLAPVLIWYTFKIGDKIQAKYSSPDEKLDINKVADNVFLVIGSTIMMCSLLFLNSHFGISDYFMLKTQQTTLYEEYYADPDDIKISCDEQNKNLIILYLESMETSYASTQDGGGQDINYIPHLTQLAKEEVNFTEDGLLGGFHNTAGSSWTAGALFSTTSGLPYPTGMPVEKSENSFAPKVTSLYDILDKNGYNQYYLCGSDAYFGGRSIYYQSHGNLTIYDHNTAKNDGYISDDYDVWWGYEDAKLYDIAKDKITAAAATGEPFSFTMLTADTHFPQGYICQKCRSDHDSVVENVLLCADCQANDFISWCKTQDFYKDTVIVVMGDHPRMDKVLPKDVAAYERTTYAVFVNCDDKAADSANRIYTQLDIMPTTLAAMGFKIEGNRLALGTNLFSDKATLAEELGFATLNSELGKGSEFLKELFAAE